MSGSISRFRAPAATRTATGYSVPVRGERQRLSGSNRTSSGLKLRTRPSAPRKVPPAQNLPPSAERTRHAIGNLDSDPVPADRLPGQRLARPFVIEPGFARALQPAPADDDAARDRE